MENICYPSRKVLLSAKILSNHSLSNTTPHMSQHHMILWATLLNLCLLQWHHTLLYILKNILSLNLMSKYHLITSYMNLIDISGSITTIQPMERQDGKFTLMSSGVLSKGLTVFNYQTCLLVRNWSIEHCSRVRPQESPLNLRMTDKCMQTQIAKVFIVSQLKVY